MRFECLARMNTLITRRREGERGSKGGLKERIDEPMRGMEEVDKRKGKSKGGEEEGVMRERRGV